jgi:chromosome segregation ATPase
MSGNLHLELENVGGIEHKELSLAEGPTFIQGPNAANKSSFLRGLLFALGSRTVPVRSGADEARVVLSTDERRVERVARRTGSGVRTEGEAWVTDADDVTLLERFAGVLGTNALRSAVARNEDVESLLKEPMDIEALERERARKVGRKRELTAELESAGDVEDRLESTERDLADTRERLEELESTLAELRDERDPAETDDALERLREERTELRSEAAECETQVGELEAAIDRLEKRRTELTATLEEAREAAGGDDVGALERERESVQSELEDVTERLDILQSVLTANREMLDSGFTGVLGSEAGLMGDDLTCWTCGQPASVDDVEETVEELVALVEEDKRRQREREPEIEELTDGIERAREAEREVRRLESEMETVERTLTERRDSLEERRERRRAIRERLDELDEKIAARRAGQASAQSGLAEEIEETRVEAETLRREVDRLEEARDSLRERRAELQRKRDEVDRLSEEVAALTDRVENRERELRTVFNETMDELLEALAFEGTERVWLDGEFDLVVARAVDGRTRADSVEHLAESEREMVGLVLALAGYVTYDVDDVSPVLVLDSLGAFDAERTRRLVDYFADETDYLVATVHPEAAVDAAFETVQFEPPARS